MKKHKTCKMILSVVLILTLLATLSISMLYAEPDNTKAYEDIIGQKVTSVLEDGFLKFYNINHTKVTFDDIKVNDEKFEADVFVTMNTTLKAKNIEELPYVKGMLKKVNLNDFSYESKEKTDIALANANKGILASAQMVKAAKEIDFRFNDLKQYINKESDNNFYLKVTADLSNGNIVEDSIKILAENIDTYIPVEQLLPKSAVEMEGEGFNDMQLVLDSQDGGYSTNLYAGYDRIAARDYANYWCDNTTTCYDHGTTCGIRQIRPNWNNSTYAYYTELCHNDCADLVSQSLHAGGIPMDSTWKRGTPANTTIAWVNTGYLKTYMLTTKGYWKASTYTSASAGGVLYTASSHVVLIVKNDTVTRQFSGHTNDRNQCNYSNVAGYLYYILW